MRICPARPRPPFEAMATRVKRCSRGLQSVLVCMLAAWIGGAAVTVADAPRFLFVGDILLSRNVAEEMQSNPASPWQSFDSLFKKSDWVMGNLEGAVGDPKDCSHAMSGPCFAIPESLIADLHNAGFSALGMAN